MNIYIKRIILCVCIVLNCITIFYFSNQNAQTSGGSSGRVVKWITQIIPGLRDLEEAEKVKVQEEIMQPIVRKLAHFSIYTLLGILTMSCALTYKGTNYQRGLITFLFGLLYACSDEFHQLFVMGRSCEMRDVLIDTLGSFVGILIYYKIKLYINKRQKLT